MNEIDLNIWFYDLPACQQMDIIGFHFATYEKFHEIVNNWWDELDYENKLLIYEMENL